MKIQNATATSTYLSHVISAPILEKKIPNLGTGKNWKTKKIRLNGERVAAMFKESSPTGVYFRFAGNVNYVKERAILEEGSLKVIERVKAEPKPKAEKKAKAEKPAGNGKSKGKGAKAPKAKPEPEAQPEGDTGAA